MHFPDLEKSWNLKKKAKIMDKIRGRPVVVACGSWKNHARVMEIMEFESGKALGTLKYD